MGDTQQQYSYAEESEEMYSTVAWAKTAADSEFSKIKIKRNTAGPDDVTFELKYCGICHTDVHIAANDMGSTKYPCVPGHELAGVVTAVGKNVTKCQVGDHVGVGCVVDSCLSCPGCDDGEEHMCQKEMTMTYDADIKHGHIKTGSGWTFGGYSCSQTVHQRFVIKVPGGFPLEAAGPVFCAGITMYSPLANWGAGKGGKRVGIVGIGGLGQMGVRIAKAMGNTVTAISTSPNKEAAAREIGADNFVISTDPASMKAAAGSLDLILNTVSADHDLNTYLPLLAARGVLVQMGVALTPHPVSQFPLMFKKLSIAGSLIGGLPETQDCIDFCHKHDIIPKIKLVNCTELERVYQELKNKNDTIIRNVLDIEASKAIGDI